MSPDVNGWLGVHRHSPCRCAATSLHATILAAVLLAVFRVGGVAHADEPPTFLLKWGSQGSGNGQFSFPSNLAIDAMGNVYVTEAGNRRVQRFSNNGAFILKWDGPGFGGDAYDSPAGVTTHGLSVFVNDRGVVGEFMIDGSWVDSIVVKGPFALDVDPTGQWLYATRSDSVYKYSIDGVFVTQWGTLAHSLTTIGGIAVGPSGNVYLTEGLQDAIWKFSPNGVQLKVWGGRGSGDGEFDNPFGIATDAQENVYVCDGGNNRIQKFTSEGEFLTKWGRPGTGDGEFGGPIDVAVDAEGNVFVLEASNRVQKFGDAPTPSARTTWGNLKRQYLSGSGEAERKGP